MPSPSESREVLQLVTGEAVALSLEVLANTSGTFEARRAELLVAVPSVIDYYADGSAALAADFYEEQRELAGVSARFSAEPVVVDRTVKIRSAIAWAAAPLLVDPDDVVETSLRLSGIVQLETARPFRDTILTNSHNDPQSVGWRRITRGGCKLCRMLADRGAVYRKETATFAAHPNCHCTAQPVYKTDVGEEASVMQYKASRRSKTEAQRADLRAYLDTYY